MAQKVEIEIRLDNRNFSEGANKVKLEISAIARQTESEGGRMGGVFDNLGKKVAGAFAVSKLIEFEKKIIDVRGEMEKLQVSFETLAGKQIGHQLYEDVKQFATTTPMMMNDLAKGAQTLLGFNIEAEKVMPILRQIGDISMGDAQKFNSLTLAFAQMSSTGKLMGQDLLQMINAGFNPLVIIAEKSGKSVAQLKDEMSKGKVTVEMVEEAFRAATSEGGMFNGMLEKQSKTMAGAISNLQGAWQDMLNDIGEKQQGLMSDGISLATDLVKNYEKVGQILLGLVSTYGTYKAAVIAVTLAETTANGQRMITVKWLKAMKVAQDLLNKTMLANPYVAAAAALGLLAGAIIAARDGMTDAERAQRDYNSVLQEARERQEDYNRETEEAIRLANDDSAATGDRESAMQTLISRYPDIIQKYIDEKGHLTDILNLKREIAAYDGQVLNQDNKVRADMYRKYVQVLKKASRGEQLNETENQLYQGAKKKYNDATPWYSRLSGEWSSGAIGYFQNMEKQANRAYGRYNTEQKVNELATKMGEMGTEELKKLSQTLTKAANEVQKGQAKYLKEASDWLEQSDYLRLSATAQGILDARNKKKDPQSDKTKKDHTAEQDAQRRQKLFELKQKELEDQAIQEMATRESVNAARIASIRSDAERQRAEEDEQYRLDMEAIDRRSEEMRKKRYEAMKAEWEAQNKDKTKIWADTKEAKDVAENGYGSVQLSQAEEEQLAADRRKREEEYKRLIEQRYREEAQALLDYLKEYGSVEEKKYAIAKEYDERISKERDANRKKYLEAEKQKQLDAIDVEILRTEIDWTTMFDGIGSALEDEMKATLEKIEKYMQTDAFKRLDAKDKREFVNMRNDLSQKTGSGVGAFDFSVYGKIADELKAYQEAMHTHKQAVIAHTAAVNKLKEADKEVEEAKEQLKKAVTEEETLIAKKNLTEKTLQQKVAHGNVTATGQFVNQAKGEVVVTQGNVTRTVSEAEKAINNFGSALNQMSNGTLKGFADGLVNLVNSISEGDTKGLSGLGKAGGIVGAILSIIDALGDDPAKFVDQLFDKVANVLEAVISQLPQIIMSIVKGAGNIVASLGKGILGAFGIGQDNHQEQVRYQEKLTKSINSTTKALDKMTEQLEKSYGIMAIQNQKSAEELIRKNMEAIMNGIDSVLSDNYGGGNSDYYHLNKNQSVLAQIQSYGSMFGVNAKEGGKYTWQQLLRNNSDDVAQLFKYIQEHDAELWRQITQESGYNDGALEEWIQKLIDTYDQIAENDKQLKEQLTTTSEENVYDDFLESLYNLADGSEDVTEDIAENWQKMINRMAVNNLVAENFREKLKLWYEDLADLNQRLAEGMDPDEYNAGLQALQDRYNKMVSDATGDIERLSQIGVIKAIEKAEEEVKGYAETVRSAFQELLSGTVDDVEQWAKDIRKTIAQDIMESLLLDEEFDKWSKDWSQRYADLLKAKNTGKVDDQSYKEQLKALLDEFDDMTGALSEKGKQMMADFGEEMAADTSFKDMTDSWISSLMDFEATAEDWAENLGRMMAQKIIKELVAPTLLQPYLDALQKAMNDALSAEGATWESVLSNGTVLSALDDIKKAYPELQKVIQDVMSALGITPDTEAAKDAFADLSGTIVSSLMDTEKTAEDFGKEIGRKLVEQMLAQIVESKFSDRIKKIQDIWAAVLAGESEYTLEDVEKMIAELREDVGRETKTLTDTIRKVVDSETPFDGLRSSLLSVLSDMSGDIDGFADDINKKITEALIDQFVLGDAFNDWLDGLKKDYSKILSDKTLSPVERTKALQGLTEIVKDQTRQYQEQAKMIHELWGTNTVKDQSAYMNTAEKITYDQADIIAGMTTSLVMGQQQGNEVREQILQALKAMSGITGSGTNYGEQIYNRLGTTNDYLLIIKEQVKNYLGPMNDKLSTILSKL